MAKGNLFLGMARGSVGDVTLYRAYGEQVSRARNRHPRNPQTFNQMVQRAVNASVSRLYSIGSAIFDHSFEGRSVGQKNQARFMQVNMAKLRDILISEFNMQPGDANLEVARIGAPGLKVAVPFSGCVVSEGSYSNNYFYWDGTNWACPGISGYSTIKAYAQDCGLVPGDIYTLGGIVIDQTSEPLYMAPGGGAGDEGQGLAIRQSYFFFEQFRVKDGVLDDSTTLDSQTNFAAIFDVRVSDSSLDSLGLVKLSAASSGFFILGAAQNLDTPVGCSFVIRSHEGSDLRSNSRLVAESNYGANTKWGLTARFLEDAWMPSSQLDGNELILDGSEYNN